MSALKTVAVSMLVSIALLVGALPTAAQRGPQSFFVGDSIGAIMHEADLLAFDTIDSVPGRPMQEGPAIIKSFDLLPGDILTVELGSNNLMDPLVRPAIDAILAVVPDDLCMQWVVPQAFMVPTTGTVFLSHLTAAIASDGQCATLIRWDALGNALLTYDTVHPNPLGAWYLAALIQPTTEPLWL